jgi:hypothetical protein
VLILAADLAAPDQAVAALSGIREGVLTDADGHPQWLLARVPLAALRARVAALRQEHPSLDGLPASALLGSLEGRHPVAASVHADIDRPADLAGLPATAPAQEDRIHGTV